MSTLLPTVVYRGHRTHRTAVMSPTLQPSTPGHALLSPKVGRDKFFHGQPRPCSPDHSQPLENASSLFAPTKRQLPYTVSTGRLFVHHHGFVVVVMEGNAVEFQERICNLATRCRHPRVQRHTLELARGAVASNIHASAVFDAAEIDRVNSPSLMRDHGWLHVAE